MAGPGNRLERRGADEAATEDMHAAALRCFAEREQQHRRHAGKTSADGGTEPTETSVVIDQAVFPRGRPQDPGTLVLRNEFPAPLAIGGLAYPTVTHAYWAPAVADQHPRAETVRTGTPCAAQKLAESSTLRDGRHQVRTTITADLLRAEFTQHPGPAEALAGTGTTRLVYMEGGSTFWGRRGLEGRNWMRGLLELVRSNWPPARWACTCEHRQRSDPDCHEQPLGRCPPVRVVPGPGAAPAGARHLLRSVPSGSGSASSAAAAASKAVSSPQRVLRRKAVLSCWIRATRAGLSSVVSATW